MATPVLPTATTTIAAHGPYEDLLIAFINLFVELIKGQTPEQKAQLWANWITLTQPLIDLIKKGV